MKFPQRALVAIFSGIFFTAVASAAEPPGAPAISVLPDLHSCISVYVMSLPANVVDQPNLSVAALKQYAGGTWRRIGGLTGASKSETSSKFLNFHSAPADSFKKPPAADAPSEIPAGLEGSVASLNVVLGPDGQTFSATVDFQFRGSVGEGHGNAQMQFDGSFSGQAGNPVVLQIFQASSAKSGQRDARVEVLAVVYQLDQILPALPSPAPALVAPTPAASPLP